MADKKVSAKFSRIVPFYLLPDGDLDSDGFDAYPVEVDQGVLDLAVELRELERRMQELFDEMPAPEEKTQDEANFLAAELIRISGVI